jgi:O-antigen/teichoic acid export membrane protein
MAGGLLVFAVAGYAFVALTGRTLSKGEANLAISFYFLVNVFGPGIFAALEQVASRTTSRALTANLPLGAALRRVRRAGGWLVGTVMVLLVLLAPVMVGTTLHGDWVLYGLVLATPAINAALHLARGQLAGLRRFGHYAAVLAIEGAARLVFCVLLVAGHTDVAWIYGVAYLAASVAALLAAMVWLRADGPAGSGSGDGGGDGSGNGSAGDGGGDGGGGEPVGKSLAALAVATLFAQLLPNIAPLVVTSRMAEDSAVALAFGQAAVIARIPLLLFFPIQTMLLPNLTAAVTRGALDVVARRMRLFLAGIVGFGAVAAVLFVLLGPWVLRTFLSATVDLDASTMLLLATSTVVLIAACAVQPALVALRRDRVVTAGWAAGSAVTLGLGLLLADPVDGAAIGQVVGPGLTLLVALLGLRAGLRSPGGQPTRSVDVEP